ncbi:hypothetical protein [Rhizobium sp. C4]|uniref:hypothetical protein n=1 Tax=Rhizobium sp. C4 TaxID=1349800 RepID=UPI001E3CC4B2|nr:hypothetical protein [Rhizobium sp. C4]MCD2175000.1 hypothetical protein [Rhizobium sp. C4]
MKAEIISASAGRHSPTKTSSSSRLNFESAGGSEARTAHDHEITNVVSVAEQYSNIDL